jgi:hypothetical protein
MSINRQRHSTRSALQIILNGIKRTRILPTAPFSVREGELAFAPPSGAPKIRLWNSFAACLPIEFGKTGY